MSENRTHIISTHSEPLKALVRITNHVSSNVYDDAILKTIGLNYSSENESISSFEKGVYVLKNHLAQKQINTSPLWMFDGSGLAITDKVSAQFLCDLLTYMGTRSSVSNAFIESIQKVGAEGTVKNTLQGSKLDGKARLKSGTMSRVRCYAGYVEKDNTRYAVALLVNNFSCKQSQMKIEIEQLLLSLF